MQFCHADFATCRQVDKFESTDSVHNIPTRTRVRPGRSTENITAVSENVEKDFENEAGNAVIVNGFRYRNMLTNFYRPIIDNINVSDMWLQQVGVTQPH